MSSQSASVPTKRTSFSGFAGNNASIFLDRTKAAIRGSTPDSEALASSDDEPDQLHRLHTVTSNPGPKAGRRASWFTDGQQGITRKASLGGGPFSPVSPGTTSSAGDQPPWNMNPGSSTTSTIGRGHSNSASFPWGNPIWNSDSQKGPPQRLTEVLPSPTTLIPSGSINNQQDDVPLRSPSLAREQAGEGAIPFSIPLQPTLKSYRSQSYSVGQIDPESATNQSGNYGAQGAYPGARRGGSYTGLHHRPSRPSMLADTAHDPNALGQLREVEDDEESSTGSASGFHSINNGARTVEDIVGENTMLRQQLAANHRAKSRNGLVTSSVQRPQTAGQYYHQRLREPLHAEIPSALYVADDQEQYDAQNMNIAIGRRFSEYGTRSGPHYALNVNADCKTLESVRKGQWQSSLGFARVEDPPQSRRHSFAEMPTRRNSMGSIEDGDPNPPDGDFEIPSVERHGLFMEYRDINNGPTHSDTGKLAFQYDPIDKTGVEISLVAHHSHDRDFAVGYFTQNDPSLRNESDLHPPDSSTLHRAYPHNHFGRSQHLAHAQGRANQLLYIITFKCLRADVFYVQEGTGLQINKGDLVIVEADRGTDLGTIQTGQTTWAEAKHLKEIYTRKHHEWLMAFSQHTLNGTIAGPNPNGPPISNNSATPSNHAGFQDIPSGELKPKMIKRLAQSHEIVTLREKEGSEAKAKRMCQQKVADHHLSMEILDAEFQMDWKKLTFYYFADSYINFNPLVTDLFKIYKTRIWMSAINTAAIASPQAGPRPSVMASRTASNYEHEDYRSAHYVHPATTTAAQIPISGLNTLYDPSRNGILMGGMAYEQEYSQTMQTQGYETRQLSPYPTEYRGQGQQLMNMASPFSHSTAFTPHLHHTSSFTSQPESKHGGHQGRPLPTRDWVQGFQELSLGR